MLLIASLFLGIAVFLFARSGYLPLWRWLKMRTDQDAERYQCWVDELFMDWSPEQARRAALSGRSAIGVAAAVVLLLSGSIVFAGFAAFLVYKVPPMVFDYAMRARRKRFEEQLPDAISVMVSSVRAGNALPSAIDEVSRKMPAPVAQEFGLIAREHLVGGISIEEALSRARTRLATEGFTLVSTALIINSGQGGDLLHILERMAEAIRELFRLQKKIETETSEVRAQRTVIMVMTPLFLGLVCLFDDSIPEILFHTMLGNLLLVAVFVIQAACILWIQRIVRTTV